MISVETDKRDLASFSPSRSGGKGGKMLRHVTDIGGICLVHICNFFHCHYCCINEFPMTATQTNGKYCSQETRLI